MKVEKGWAWPDADEFMVQQMPDDGGYQGGQLAAAMRYVKAWDLAVDGGAHVGTWTFTMASKFKRVVSFEPSPDTFEALWHNMRELHPALNAELRNQALGKSHGHVTMTLDGFEQAIEMKNTGGRFAKEGGEIERITLDSLDLPALDFLKLDVEGGEVDAILGARDTLVKFKPVVLFEDKYHWMRYGYSKKAPHELLTSLGARHLHREVMDEIWGWE